MSAVVVLLFIGGSALLYTPRRPKSSTDAVPIRRHDERDLVFARAKLVAGTPRYDEYYARKPELKSIDDAFRELPGLLDLKSTFYHPYVYAAARANFEVIYYGLYYYSDHLRFPREVCPDSRDITRFIKEWAKSLGAVSIGVTDLRDYHVYTHRGYGDDYGKESEPRHTYAIAMTVEMDYLLSSTAPKAGTWFEVGHKYVATATLSALVAGFIRQLGYSAHANMLDNHATIAPLVARDAGLGEIGRSSILLTPDLGPRVRLAVVTTDLPLEVDAREPDHGVLDLCLHCTKCADCCPADAIPTGPPGDEDGVLRWKIDHEACFSYWRKTGAPCGRCISTCPLARPNTLVDRVMKRVATNSPPLRTVALALHDHFYGRKPKSLPMPDWVTVAETPEEARAGLPVPLAKEDYLKQPIPTVRVPGPDGIRRPIDLR